MKDEKQEWYFTFGQGHSHPNGYVKIYGTHGSARAEMVRRYGPRWAFQYPTADKAGIDRYMLQQIE